jgi:hypothetical protein
LGSHQVAVVNYTYTHKQYRERHKTNNTYNNTKIHRTTQKIHKTTQKLGRVRAVPRLYGFYPGICFTTEEKARKNQNTASFQIFPFSSPLYLLALIGETTFHNQIIFPNYPVFLLKDLTQKTPSNESNYMESNTPSFTPAPN